LCSHVRSWSLCNWSRLGFFGRNALECNVGHFDELLFSLLSCFHHSPPAAAAADANADTHEAESNHKEHPEGRDVSVWLPVVSVHVAVHYKIWTSHMGVKGDCNRTAVQLCITNVWSSALLICGAEHMKGRRSLRSVAAFIATRQNHSQTIGIHINKGNQRGISKACWWKIQKSGDTNTRVRVAFRAACVQGPAKGICKIVSSIWPSVHERLSSE